MPLLTKGFRLFKIQSLSTYGHSQLKTGHPVRSAIHKQLNGRLDHLVVSYRIHSDWLKGNLVHGILATSSDGF
ncbi:hypothetical protein KCU68_g8192, partial [Aureobasidium melanogenum]